jgi:histone H3/H4
LYVLIPDHALREIRYYQKSTALLIPRLPFSRVVKDCIEEHARQSLRLTSSALGALQASAEKMLVLYFELMNKAAIHAKRTTIMQRDHTFVQDFIRAIDPTHALGVEASLEQKKGPIQARAMKSILLRRRGEMEKAKRLMNAGKGKGVAKKGAGISKTPFSRNPTGSGGRAKIPTGRKTVPKGRQGG